VEFAAWEDPELEVTAWRKPNVVVDPKYADLRQRYDVAAKRLLERLAKPVRGGNEVRKRITAEQSAIAIAQQLVTERFEHNATRKELRLALANQSMPPTANGKGRVRLVKG